MTMAFDPANWRDAAIQRRKRLYNPRNAKPDNGINIKNGWPVEVEKPKQLPAIPVLLSDHRDPMAMNLLGLKALAKAMKESDSCDFRRSPKIEEIQKVVVSFYPVDLQELKSPRRAARLVLPRQIAMYLAKEMTGRSYPEIGRMFGNRDHTTIIHAVRKISNLLETDERIRDEIQILTMRIYERCGIEPQKEDA